MRLLAVGAAALALVIFQPDNASAQARGAQAGGGHGGHSGHGGFRGGPGHRGLAMHRGAPRGGVWGAGLVGRPGWGWPGTIGVTAETWGYIEQCEFLTHYGRVFPC